MFLLKTLDVSGTKINFKIDTGADITLIPYSVYQSIAKRPALEQPTEFLEGAGGSVDCIGKFVCLTHYKGCVYKFDTYIAKNSTRCLLGRNVSIHMGLVKVVDAVNSSVYGDIGLLRGEPVTIKLHDKAVPFSVNTARQIPIPLVSKVKGELCSIFISINDVFLYTILSIIKYKYYQHVYI